MKSIFPVVPALRMLFPMSLFSSESTLTSFNSVIPTILMAFVLVLKISFLFYTFSFVKFFLYFLLSVTFWNCDPFKAISTKSDNLGDRFGDLIARFFRLNFLHFFTLLSFNVIFNVKFQLIISFFISSEFSGYADFMVLFNSLSILSYINCDSFNKSCTNFRSALYKTFVHLTEKSSDMVSI